MKINNPVRNYNYWVMAVQIWTSDQKNDDKIIAYFNDAIYKGNPPLHLVEENVAELNMQRLPSKYFFSVPLHYISQINLQKGKNYIEVVFRGDVEHLKISDDRIRNQVFDFFKKNIPGAAYSVTQPSVWQAVKKPVIAMGVICIIFTWCLYIAKGQEAGLEYDVEGQHYHSIAGIVLVLASMGVRNLILLFGSLFIIAGISAYLKYKNPVVKDTLSIKH